MASRHGVRRKWCAVLTDFERIPRPKQPRPPTSAPVEPKEKMSGATHHQSRRSHATAAALSAGICPYPEDAFLRPPLTPDVCKERSKPALRDLLQLAKSCVLLYRRFNQPLHVVNVAVRPMLDGQLAQCLHREG